MIQVKVGILGHFGEGKDLLNGQTVKTRIVTEELYRRLGARRVTRMDSHGGFKTLIKAPFQIASLLHSCENIIILPAQNGLRVYAPLLSLGNRFFKNRRLHYVVIGGWLPDFLQKHAWLVKPLKRFSGIYVETNTMKIRLESQGLDNVVVMPNCKKLKVLQEDELVYPTGEPYKLCTFSRVMKEKGIEDAVNAVKAVNEILGRTVYTLDIFGQVDAAQTEWFESLQKEFPEYIRYAGCISFDQSVTTIKDYFLLLFPTHFYTEGIPGTIIDAYAAGVPVIASEWESCMEVVDGKTGITYDFDQVNALEEILMALSVCPEKAIDMKHSCVYKARHYLPEEVVDILVSAITV